MTATANSQLLRARHKTIITHISTHTYITGVILFTVQLQHDIGCNRLRTQLHFRHKAGLHDKRFGPTVYFRINMSDRNRIIYLYLLERRRVLYEPKIEGKTQLNTRKVL